MCCSWECMKVFGKTFVSAAVMFALPFGVVTAFRFTARVEKLRPCTREDPCLYFKLWAISNFDERFAPVPYLIHHGMEASDSSFFHLATSATRCNTTSAQLGMNSGVSGGDLNAHCSRKDVWSHKDIVEHLGMCYHGFIILLGFWVTVLYVHDVALQSKSRRWPVDRLFVLHIVSYIVKSMMIGLSLFWALNIVEPIRLDNHRGCGCWYGPDLVPSLVSLATPGALLLTIWFKETYMLRVLISNHDYLTTQVEHAAFEAHAWRSSANQPAWAENLDRSNFGRRSMENKKFFAAVFARIAEFFTKLIASIAILPVSYTVSVVKTSVLPIPTLKEHPVLSFVLGFGFTGVFIWFPLLFCRRYMTVSLWRLLHLQVTPLTGEEALLPWLQTLQRWVTGRGSFNPSNGSSAMFAARILGVRSVRDIYKHHPEFGWVCLASGEQLQNDQNHTQPWTIWESSQVTIVVAENHTPPIFEVKDGGYIKWCMRKTFYECLLKCLKKSQHETQPLLG